MFTVHLNTDDTDYSLELTEITGGIINMNKGVVLKSNNASIELDYSENGSNHAGYSNNSLKGTMTTITTNGENYYYVLNYKEGNGKGVGFYKLTSSGGTIGDNKAYLIYIGGSNAREFFLFEDDDATGIDMPTVESSNTDAVVYDLQGRRVQNPTKGLYIVNGKKVIIK